MMLAEGMKKSSYNICNCFSFWWAIQGLNLGPPDYENDKMIFYDNQRF